jgi:putative tryptophan/tyrosine transport system substrate-binding protein
MKRREFIAGLGSLTAWPLAARAQQPGLPVIGFLHVGAPESAADLLLRFRKGPSEMGYVEGRNLAFEFRWANNDFARLPDLAADLVRRRVAVIVAYTTSAALAAKAATDSIPVVFLTGGDAVEAGLVVSLDKPGGNVTGFISRTIELGPKRLQLLHELRPTAMRFGFLVNPNAAVQLAISRMEAAAATIGRPIEIVTAGTNREIDTAFATIHTRGVDALVVFPVPFFSDHYVQLTALTLRHAVPTIFFSRIFVDAGGLMSYAPNIFEQFRQAGLYSGRILKGENPSDLPVMQPTRFEFVINQQTARTLGIDVPPTLLAIADEVIE